MQCPTIQPLQSILHCKESSHLGIKKAKTALSSLIPTAQLQHGRKLPKTFACDLRLAVTGVLPLQRAVVSRQIANGEIEKAETLNDTFINENTALRQGWFPLSPLCLTSVFSFDKTSATDVQQAIRGLPNKSSTGSDEISY